MKRRFRKLETALAEAQAVISEATTATPPPVQAEESETSKPTVPVSIIYPATADSGVTDAKRIAALGRVRKVLLKAGATEEEIDQAVVDDVVDMLAVDRLLVPAPRKYTEHEIAEMSGLPVELLKRIWRALGFHDVREDERAFSDLDLEAVKIFQGMAELGVVDIDGALQMARIIGSSMARIAEAEVAPGTLAFQTEEDSVIRADAFVRVADRTLPGMSHLLDFVWRRHVQAATRRTIMLRSSGTFHGTSPVLAVGFADMVGFTLLSQHLSQEELAQVVRRFEQISHDIVTSLGGRVVKMIGDEVMFVVESTTAAARIGLGLAAAYADDELLSDVRVGMAFGPIVISDGDFYGPIVNMAHRIVNIGNPGTVLVSDDFHTALMDEAGDEFTALALKPRSLKDIGRVQLFWLGRTGEEINGSGSGADRRRNLRWERLSEVLRDLEEFRDAGERLLSSGRSAVSSQEYPGARAPEIASADANGGDSKRS